MPSPGDTLRSCNVLELRKPHSSSSHATKDSSVIESTLVIFFSWLGAPQYAVDKYCSIYQTRGFHVLVVAGRVSQFAWPHNSLRLAHKLMNILQTELSQFPNLLVHGTSIGCFNYSSCVALASRFPKHHGNFLDRLKGVVLDSMTQGSLQCMVKGMMQGSGLSGTQQYIFSMLLDMYFWATHVETVRYFERAVKFFCEHPAEVPTLVLASLDDPMSDPESLEAMLKMWRDSGKFTLIEKVWEHSAHCAHLKLHTEEYIQKLEEFLWAYSRFVTAGRPQQKLRSKV